MFVPLKLYGNLSEKVVSQIIQALNTGNLKPGDRLPPEREMCEMFSVSRTVIRDALKTLAGLGVVTVRHGTGTFINEATDEPGDISRLASLLQISRGTMEELFQVRGILESKAVFWCAQNATDEDIAELEDIVRSAEHPENEGKLALFDAEFHLKICEAAGNRVLVRLMINVLDLLGEVREKVLMIPGRQRLSVRDHQEILAAIRERNPDLACQRMLNHLKDSEDAVSAAQPERGG
ncbi:FadR/GntR family transcriptional regulator [Desulfitobacterium chlororespirans]|uniref:Transcriptional regulator, GntR family n=1 Tax=Desulfitobacterium chlororespirans DSM 11544 TaxID=1121395 RepID=A0A1M7SE65_9FIRM|nr:FadR/GntR family transcriptional regulator [Desulfitobacterium chlororespirans]SHN56734.1 transcriptional regulator, GntR family [Desulfitobacterium chlororespirans DSM 11544]